jgi:serine/threonine protein kinase/tetratricopeptide (TPR) repeat protein
MATQPGAQGEFRRPQDQQSTQPPAESQKLAGGNPPNEQSEASRQAARPSEKEDTLTSLEEDSLQPPGAGREPPPEVPPPEKVMQVAQYRTVKKIGKGGMGVVYLADDLVLNRKVAIKFAHTPALQARFQREAEITALLEHPGVVPVLMRGQQDGRLYYVMRYVEGERFDQAIHSWHESCQSARDFRRTKVQLQFRELLQRFVAVCQTVAYAHSRGIIHRDLKPSNILLGRFGETIVLDWGLARRKSVDGDAGSPDSARPPDGADDHHTRPGAKLGTEAYMAPEQVDGKPADERTDVFLLGATLYHLLTGQPPFCLGRPAKPPRQLKPWIPAALQAICRKAMADDPQARYATAEQLAADVKRWLADEPVAVYREPLGQRLARWLRRQRTLAGVAAVVVLVVVPLTIGFSLLVAAKNQELSQTNRDLESALAREEDQRRQAEQARQVAEQRRAEAEEARQLADQRRQQAERAADRARSVIELVASDEAFDQLSRKKQLTAEEKKLLEALVPYYEEYARESGSGKAEQERQARAYFQLSRTLHLLGRHEPAEKAYRQALPLYERLVAEHPQVPQYRHQLAIAYNNIGVLLEATGRADEAEKAIRKALEIQERLVADRPELPQYCEELARMHINLAMLSRSDGRVAEAEKAYGQALEVYQRLAAEYPDVRTYQLALAETYADLGTLLERSDRPAEAEGAYRHALQLYERLAALSPQSPEYQLRIGWTLAGMGTLYATLGKTPDAARQLERAEKLLRELSEKNPDLLEAQRLLELVTGMSRHLGGT